MALIWITYSDGPLPTIRSVHRNLYYAVWLREVFKMSRYTGPVGGGGAFLIVLTCILVLVAPPIGFIMSLALAFWKD